jgi:DNA-binding LytR/AlgR family response regulator
MQVLIVEDEALYAGQLEILIDKLGYDHLATLNNGKEVLQLLEKRVPDLVLMDIHINGDHDGIELTERIHEEYPVPVIFITSMADDLTFNRASRTQAVHFILKPFDELQLQRAIEWTVRKMAHQRTDAEGEEWKEDVLFEDHFYIKKKQKLEKVVLDEVRFAEADGHYCTLHTGDQKYMLRMSFSELLNKLPGNNFLQTHRSFVANKTHVDSINLEDSVLEMGEATVPLSKGHRDKVLEALKWYG